MGSVDRIFRDQDQYSGAGSFRFDGRVATVFDDMAARSIPFYSELQHSSALLAAACCPAGGRIYDLGCSTGNTLLALSSILPAGEQEIIGVDSSPEMLEACRAKLAQHGARKSVALSCSRVEEMEFLPCDLVIMNYTLQFVAPDRRTSLLARIHSALRPGGALLLSEKTRPATGKAEVLMEHLYHDFKGRNGYSRTEIERKKEALEGVLIPQTIGETMQQLTASGFKSCEILFKSYHFTTMLAFR